MSKSVFVLCGAHTYTEAALLAELLDIAGIGAELVEKSLTKDPERLLLKGQERAVNADVFITVHSHEFCFPNFLEPYFTKVIDATLEIGNGLFVVVIPLPVYGRWDADAYHLLKNDSKTLDKDLSRLIAQIKKMLG